MPERTDPTPHDAQQIRTHADTDRQRDANVSELTLEQKVALADRLLNDPDVPLEPHRVWAILEQLRLNRIGDEI